MERIDGALRTLHAGGWTDLGAGWLSGCAQVGEATADSALGRCLLLTDGLANHGITDPDELVRHAAELRRRGVTTSTLGVGHDFDESLLRRLAKAAGGHFYYASSAAQIPTMVEAEVGEALDTARIRRSGGSAKCDRRTPNPVGPVGRSSLPASTTGTRRSGGSAQRDRRTPNPAGTVGRKAAGAPDRIRTCDRQLRRVFAARVFSRAYECFSVFVPPNRSRLSIHDLIGQQRRPALVADCLGPSILRSAPQAARSSPIARASSYGRLGPSSGEYGCTESLVGGARVRSAGRMQR